MQGGEVWKRHGAAWKRHEGRKNIAPMPRGGVLRLVTQDWVPEGPHGVHAGGALLRVEDAGHGLSAETQERLFRPFFTTKNDGNGLGLWISQGLVERYGGSISATNRLDGSGAVFTVQLLTDPQAPSATATNDGRPGGL